MTNQTINELKSIKVDLLTRIEAINLILELFEKEKQEIKSNNIDLSTIPKMIAKKSIKNKPISKSNWRYRDVDWFNEVYSKLKAFGKPVMLKDICDQFPTVTSDEKKRLVNLVSSALFRLITKDMVKKEKTTSEFDKQYYLYSLK